MIEPLHIAVVTYTYPPSTSIAGSRWASMARHLRTLGHEVTVVTSRVHGSAPTDAVEPVVRTGDLAASGLLRRVLNRPVLAEPGSAAVLTPAPGLITRVVVPDSHLVSWLPAAAVSLRRLARASPIDVLVTTSPPHSTHLLGLLGRRSASAWLVDLRDGWLFESQEDAWPTRPQRRLDAWLERRVCTRADAVVAATRPIAEDLHERLGVPASWVSNAWDPETVSRAEGNEPPEVSDRSPEAVTLVHTGTLSGVRGKDPRPLFRAIASVNQHLARPVRLLLAGRPTAEDEAAIRDAPSGVEIVTLGLLPKRASVALQRSADGLLLLTSGDRSEATGKLFEYLAAGRPIVALAAGNEAARIVRETGTGVCVPPDDTNAIAAALVQLADGTLAERYAPRGLDRYTYPSPALELEAVASRALDRARVRG